ncbi:MAG: hypothetical protein ACRBBN_01675 [Methyloligellaceae bacterium]
MFPDYNKEIRLKPQSEQFTVPELICLLDQIGEELSRDHITEQYAQYLSYVSEQLRVMRQKAIEVAMEAEEDKVAYPPAVVKKFLPH